VRIRLAVFISVVQSVLFVGHLFLYFTWSQFWGGWASSPATKITLALLSVSFVIASLRGWYAHDFLVRLLYKIAAIWMGLASYFLWASVFCWLVFGLSWAFGLGWPRAYIADALFGAAALLSLVALVNAYWLRVTRVKVELPNLPAQWHGRTAALASDLHLGHVRNGRFIRRVVNKLLHLQPDIVFLAGDMYDGTSANFHKAAQPWAEFIAARESGSARSSAAVGSSDPQGKFHGVFAIPGNHEEFYRNDEYLPPLVASGVRFLNNEKVDVDGLQVLGVNYRDAADPESYRAVVRSTELDANRASILLLHAPVQLPVSEAEGVSLQLSGHTHGGQFFPYTWIAQRVWGKFVYGLQRLGNLQVFTSYGAGTWGPPMRLGTRPEIVLIELQPAAGS